MLNRIVLIGRLTKDPKLKYLPGNGTAVCNFTLAVDRPFAKEGQQKTDFINCQVWQKQAEACANYLAKGKIAAVDGRLQIRSYEGQDGQKKWITEVVAQDVRFLSPKGGQEDDFIAGEIEDDEIPF